MTIEKDALKAKLKIDESCLQCNGYDGLTVPGSIHQYGCPVLGNAPCSGCGLPGTGGLLCHKCVDALEQGLIPKSASVKEIWDKRNKIGMARWDYKVKL